MAKNIFIGGPLTHLSAPNSPNVDYQNLFKQVVSGLSKHAQINSAHIEEDFGKICFSPIEIANRDFRWIKEADLLLFIFPPCCETDQPLRTDGTFIELGYAVSQKKKTAIFMPNHSDHSLLTQGVLQRMPWEHHSSIEPSYIVNIALSMLDEKEVLG